MALDMAARPTNIPPVSSAEGTHYNKHMMSNGQPTPSSSASSTPDTLSPTSTQTDSLSPPNNGNMAPRRQIRAPKTPMYIPAVLRPTESPAYWRALEQGRSNLAAGLAASKAGGIANITPPQSTATSFDESDGRSLNQSQEQLHFGEQIPGAKISRIVTEEWRDSRVEDVTGSPTREHWKPDSHSIKCESNQCGVPFSLVTRRHHCRRCGKIFCSSHSAHAVPLDQHATFHPRGELGRACDSCWADFRHWEYIRKSRNNSTSGSESGSGAATPVSAGRSASQKDEQGNANSKTAFGSFCTRDWSWSTF